MRGRGQLWARIIVAAVAWTGAVVVAVTPSGISVAAASGGSTSSAVTVSGSEEFSSLKVTVSQTKELIDQVVRVSWTGGKQTLNGFAGDYLQIMQCWSDDPTGPTREQCEFGNSGDTRGGPQATTRQLDQGTTFADPAEKQAPTAKNPYDYVDFESASWQDDPARPGHVIHPVEQGDRSGLGQFFDAQSTNELPLNATGADGSGVAFFETMTAEEAPGLGCGGTAKDDAGKPWAPHCWLVVVPRGETEVNGQPASASTLGLVTSPLSTTNWAQRIVVPLQFSPIAISCPIGSPEQHVSGQEVAQEAFFRWQAKLCQQSGTVYSYAKVSDQGARRQLLTLSPGLDFLTQPVSPSAAGSSGIKYAPLDVSAAVIAFNIDYSSFGANALRPLAGQRVPAMNLTPRLVAKLITQSYLQGAPAHDPALGKSNPKAVQGLTYDPDFFAANPGLTGLDNHGGDVLMPFPPSDVTAELWAWINADRDARAFLDGKPDPWGMTVNPAYRKITDSGVPSSFPKSDPYCAPQPPVLGTQPPNLCTLDLRPYANDMHDAARSAARGDSLARSTWAPDGIPPHYGKGPLQISGSQAVLAFTDAATAARYSLPVARLKNSAGAFVAPTAAGLSAGLAAMKPGPVAGVLLPNPTTKSRAAYPLTTITYGATVPSQLTVQKRSDYADFITYAVTGGQLVGADIGQLPVGYLPLPSRLVKQALAMSVALRHYVAPTPTTASPTPTVSATTSTSAPPTTTFDPTGDGAPPEPPVQPQPGDGGSVPEPTSAAPTTAGTTVSATHASTSPAHGSVTPTVSTSATPAGAVQPVAVIRRTPDVGAGSGQYAVVVALALGGLCALSGPGLLRLGKRRSP